MMTDIGVDGFPRSRPGSTLMSAPGRTACVVSALCTFTGAFAQSPSLNAWRCADPFGLTHIVAINLATRFPGIEMHCVAVSVPEAPAAERPVTSFLPTTPWARIIEAPRSRDADTTPLLQAWMPAAPTSSAPTADSPYAGLIVATSLRHGLDPRLVDAIVAVESAHTPTARSPKGAVGLMQLMPATARRFGVDSPADLLKPSINLDAGARYLRELLEMFDGQLELAVAAYNAGEYAVIRHGGVVPPYPETRNYVTRVLARMGRMTETNPRPE